MNRMSWAHEVGPGGDVAFVSFTPTYELRYDGDALTVYGQRTANGLPQAQMTGATVCADCGRRFGAGHCAYSALVIPPAEATWHHHDCADPTLAKADTDCSSCGHRGHYGRCDYPITETVRDDVGWSGPPSYLKRTIMVDTCHCEGEL